MHELARTVEKVAHLKERRQVRLFVRREPYGRYLSCLVYLPRDRYTTAVRNRMQEILMRQLGGASIDYTARVSESVLARLHFVVRMPVGESMGDIDVRALERELTQATRSWNDEFAEILVRHASIPRHSPPWSARCPRATRRTTPPKQGMLDLQALIRPGRTSRTCRWPCTGRTGPTTRPTCGSRSSAAASRCRCPRSCRTCRCSGSTSSTSARTSCSSAATSGPSSTTSG